MDEAPPSKRRRIMYSHKPRSRSKYNPERVKDKLISSVSDQTTRKQLEEIVPLWVFFKETDGQTDDSQLFELMNKWQNLLLLNQETFKQTLNTLVTLYYPAEKRTTLDRTISTFCLMHPQYSDMIMNPLCSLVCQQTLRYRRSSAPFRAILTSLRDTFSGQKELKKTRTVAVLGWVEPANSLSLQSTNILELLWIISRINIQQGFPDIHGPLEGLKECPLSLLLIDCLFDLPNSLRESFFSKLIRKHFEECWNNFKSTLKTSRSSFLCEILHFFLLTKGYFGNDIVAMTDSFIPVLFNETQLLWKNHNDREFVIWMKPNIVSDFREPIEIYFSQSSTLRTHKLLQGIFNNSENQKEDDIFIGGTIEARHLPNIVHSLFPKIVNQILVTDEEHARQQEIYDLPLISLIFHHLFKSQKTSTDWFCLHFLPTMLSEIQGQNIASNLIQKLFEDSQYFPLLFSLYEEEQAETGIQTMLKMLYNNHSKETREKIFQYWYLGWDIIEEELLILSQSDSMSDGENVRDEMKIIDQQWEKILNLLQLCNSIEENDFLEFLEISLQRFLRLIHPQAVSKIFYSRILLYFLFSNNEREEKMFQTFLIYISNLLTSAEDKKLIFDAIQESMSKLSRTELPGFSCSLPSFRKVKPKSAKYGLKILGSVLKTEDNSSSAMIYDALANINSLENLLQIIQISTVEETKSSALEILFLIFQHFIGTGEVASLKDLWNESRISFLLDLILKDSQSSSHFANVTFEVVSQHYIEFPFIPSKIIPSLFSLLCSNPQNLNRSRKIIRLISYMIHQVAQDDMKKLQVIQAILDCSWDYLYTLHGDEELDRFSSSPNSQVLSLVLSTLSAFKIISLDETSEKLSTTNKYFQIIDEAFIGFGSHQKSVFLVQLQLLSAICQQFPDKAKERVDKYINIILQGTKSTVAAVNQTCKSILHWSEMNK